jgi:glutathione S-transferase
MITLYQLHWSHYVEKVRWVLDYKNLEWAAVDVDPFTKREMQHLQSQLTLDSGRQLHTVPTIHDHATGTVVSDSSRILEYLERTYPTPALYPPDAAERDEVARWMRWLDSTLGLTARRLGYTQIALECPDILAHLFIPETASAGSLKARVGGAIIAGVLSRRFRFNHNRADRVFEKLESCLLIAAQRVSSSGYLVGNRFTAADLTLAALSRPALLVPFFRAHARLQRLWEWRVRQLQEHHREAQIGYEAALQDVRQRRGWALGSVRWLAGECHDERPLSAEIPNLPVASNDQQPVGRWPLITGPIGYLHLKLTCGLGRTVHRTDTRIHPTR